MANHEAPYETATGRRWVDMGKPKRGGDEYRRVTKEELDALAGETLPERAAMSLINANIAIPVNAAVAANVLSDGAIAYANAQQDTPIDQSS
jgi:hypothetical protein